MSVCATRAARARRTFSFLACGLISLLFTGAVWGQSTFGEFVGTVHDPTGSVVASAVVKAVNTGTSATRSTPGTCAWRVTLILGKASASTWRLTPLIFSTVRTLTK